MSFDLTTLSIRIRKINNCINEISCIKNKLTQIKGEINNSYRADEVVYINNKFEEIIKKLNLEISNLEELKNKIKNGAVLFENK